MTRAQIMQGLSAAMTLQNVTSGGHVRGGVNLLENPTLLGGTIGQSWTNPVNADPKAVLTVPNWYINNGTVTVTEAGLNVERYDAGVANSGYFMQHFPGEQVSLFEGKLCVVGAVVNGRTYSREVMFNSLAPGTSYYFIVDFGLFGLRFHYYSSHPYRGFTVDIKETPITISNVYWSLATEKWP